MCLVAHILDSADIKHFHYHRKFIRQYKFSQPLSYLYRGGLSLVSNEGFLNLGTTDNLEWILLCCGLHIARYLAESVFWPLIHCYPHPVVTVKLSLRDRSAPS